MPKNNVFKEPEFRKIPLRQSQTLECMYYKCILISIKYIFLLNKSHSHKTKHVHEHTLYIP